MTRRLAILALVSARTILLAATVGISTVRRSDIPGLLALAFWAAMATWALLLLYSA